MKRIFLATLLASICTAHVLAQRPGDGPPRDGRPPRGFRGPPGFALMTALDVDQDGKISAAEISGAVAALRKLDKDNDGKLSGREIGWPPEFGFGRGGPGFGRRGGFGGFGGGRGGFPGFGGGFGRQADSRPRRPDPDEGVPRNSSTGSSSQRPRFFSVEQLERLDRNQDGKISKNEIPRRMQQLILGRLDTNEDEVIDKKELAALSNEP